MALNYAERKAQERKEARRAAQGIKTKAGIKKRTDASKKRKEEREANQKAGNSVFDRFKKAFSGANTTGRAAKKKREADTAKKYMENKNPVSPKKKPTRQDIAMAESIARSKRNKNSPVKPNFMAQDSATVGKGVNLKKEAESAARMDNRQDVKTATMQQKSDQTKTATNVSKQPSKGDSQQEMPKKPTFRDFKTPAAAKKAGFKSYIGKDGKEKAAVFKTELKGKTLNKFLNDRNQSDKGVPKITKPVIKKPTIGEKGTKRPDPMMTKGRTMMTKGRTGSGGRMVKKPTIGEDLFIPGLGFRSKAKIDEMTNAKKADKKGVKKMNMGGMAGMDNATMMATKKKRRPMTPAQKAMSGGASVPMMKKGGKVRGHGIARGGKACKMR